VQITKLSARNWKSFGSSPDGPQILVTSHSPLVVDQFRDSPEEVLVVERAPTIEEGGSGAGTTMVTPLTETLGRIKGKGTDGKALGDLWYSGVLGGVPRT